MKKVVAYKLSVCTCENTQRQVSINGHKLPERSISKVSYHLILIYLFFCAHLIDNDEYVVQRETRLQKQFVSAPARIHYQYLIESICVCLIFLQF